jgi:hypothetical protein
VVALNKTTFPGFESSTRHALNTLTWKLQVAVFPEESVAMQVTVVVPVAKVEPDGGLQVTIAPGQLSVTAGLA